LSSPSIKDSFTMTAAATECSTAKNAFSLAIAAYAIAWIVVFVFLYRVFGIDTASIILLLIIAFPLFVALRMQHRWLRLRIRDFAFLSVLLVIIVSGSGGAIWRLYSDGIHNQHVADIRFGKLANAAHSNMAFRNVDFSITRFKGRYIIQGEVASQSDLEHLEALCDKYGFSFYAKDVLVSSSDNNGSK